MPNVGVNIHSYLYYIITNYDNLPDIIIFLPGSAMDTYKKEKTTNTVLNTVSSNNSVFYVKQDNDIIQNINYNFVLDKYITSHYMNSKINSSSKLNPSKIRPFGKWYDFVFPNIDIYGINYHAIFSVSKKHIQNRSKQSYEELIQYVNSDSNEECAHYFERSMLAVFHPIPDNCLYVI